MAMTVAQIAEESLYVDHYVQRLQHNLIETAQCREHLAVRLQLLQTELVEAAGRLNGVRIHLGLLAPEDAVVTADHLRDVLTDAAWVRRHSFDFNQWL